LRPHPHAARRGAREQGAAGLARDQRLGGAARARVRSLPQGNRRPPRGGRLAPASAARRSRRRRRASAGFVPGSRKTSNDHSDDPLRCRHKGSEAQRASILAALRVGRLAHRSEITVAQLCAEWLETRVGRVADRTYEYDHGMVKRITSASAPCGCRTSPSGRSPVAPRNVDARRAHPLRDARPGCAGS
jgi:hypothetical protein